MSGLALRSRVFGVGALVGLFLLLGWWERTGRGVEAGERGVVQPALRDPDAACVRCHAGIVAQQRRSAMGAGSGAAMAGLLPGEFTHEASGVRYRVFARDGRAWMSYSRPAGSAAGGLDGEWELAYFVGSGRRGRTYLYEQAGEWFELPVNWYTRRARWDMAPAYEEATRMPSPLPADAGCVHCHGTEGETPLPEARNRFPVRPFDQGGVGCSACHGDGAAHVASGGKAAIANPSKMAVAARDSACVQCHLEGDAVVYRAGRTLAGFRVGDRLEDFAVYFVRASQAGGGQRASSQYEALLKSACKRGAGDRLTCTTCHDPHGDPEGAAARVQFYRARCLQCHNSPGLAVTHHPEQPDCAVCHMPSRKTADISHEQVTDHDVEARPVKNVGRPRWVDGEALVTVGGVTVGDREMGLAYAQRAEKGDREAGVRALELLRKAEAAGADDVAVHVNLGWLEQRGGDAVGARREYGQALREDPYAASALVNRAVLDAAGGDRAEAVRLLDRLVRADPSQTLAGVDLLRLECAAGEVMRARALRETLLAVNPDAAALRGAGCW